MEEERKLEDYTTLIFQGDDHQKIRLEINCGDAHEARDYLNAIRYKSSLHELDDFLRMICKHGIPEGIKDEIQFIRDKFHDVLSSNNVSLDE